MFLKKLKICLICTCSILAVPALAHPQAHADRILMNGIIITVDDKNTIAEAIAIKGGKILAVSDNKSIMKYKDGHTHVEDLQGKSVIPGIIDAHSHIGLYTLFLASINLTPPPMGNTDSIETIKQKLSDYLKSHQMKPGEWIIGMGYDDSLLKEKRNPNRNDLDQVTTEYPILLVNISPHTVTMNSKALQLANITAKTKDPAGGIIIREPGTQIPNGVLKENAMNDVIHVMPHPPLAAVEKLLTDAMYNYAENGITTAQEGVGFPAEIALFQAASSKHKLPIDVVIFPFNLFINSAFKNFAHDHTYHNGFRIGGMKVVSDGSIQGFTGYLSQPYYVQPKGDEFQGTPCNHKTIENILLHDKDIESYAHENKLLSNAPESGWRGLPAYSNQAELNKVVEQGLKNKYPMIFHSNGDAAIDQVIIAVEAGLKKYPVKDHRSTILHNLALRIDQLDKIKALGIHLSFFPTHVYYWGDRHYSIYLGPERSERMDPIASAIKHDITYTMHSDAPVTPLNPFVILWSAMSRTTSGGRLLGADERISAIEALRGLTINAAKQYFEEQNKGSLEPGKSADIVVITDNPLKMNVNKIKDIIVIETIKDGKTVYLNK